jgi:hypothetical protein
VIDSLLYRVDRSLLRVVDCERCTRLVHRLRAHAYPNRVH